MANVKIRRNTTPLTKRPYLKKEVSAQTCSRELEAH
jgi:hypothetical protein